MPLETESIDAAIERDLAADAVCRSVREQARRIGVSKSFLFEEIRIGRLASIKIGRRRLIADTDITNYIAARRKRAA